MAQKQSEYSKQHLYNLDSDDDELDFLRKDIDFQARDKQRQEAKQQKARELAKKYPQRDYFKHEAAESVASTMGVKTLNAELQREQKDTQFEPDTLKYFPSISQKKLDFLRQMDLEAKAASPKATGL